MIWVRRIKIPRGSCLKTPEDVRKRVQELRNSKSKYRKAELTIEYDPRRASRGRYDIVVTVPIDAPPGSRLCAECQDTFEDEYGTQDYLCDPCRRAQCD